MMNPFALIGDLFRNHKLKIFLTLVFSAVFAVLLFPINDLSDYVSEKISEVTGGAWYVEFESMSLNLIPSVGVNLDNVIVDGSGLHLKTDRMDISPWILGALTAKQGLSLDASGFFGGTFAADYREGDKMKSGERAKDLAFEARDLKLQTMSSFLRNGGLFNFSLGGSLNASSQLNIDPLFDRQPSGSLAMDISNFILPSQTTMVNFNGVPMPLPLPELRLGTAKLEAQVNEGDMQIQTLSFGGPQGDISGTAKGQLAMSFKRDNTGVRPGLGNFDLNMNLSLKRARLTSLQGGNLGLVFALIDKCRKESGQNVNFAFRVKGQAGLQPDISCVQ